MFTIRLLDLARDVPQNLDRTAGFANALFERLALLARQFTADIALAAREDLGGLEEDVGTGDRRSFSPAVEGLRRGRNRGLDVNLVGARKVADKIVPVGGAPVFERVAGRGRAP